MRPVAPTDPERHPKRRKAPPLLQDRHPATRQALQEDPAAEPGMGETPDALNLDN
ncbi:MAG: hypothetical protein ACK5GZ_15930 [Cyanobium sp.]|jgi:hypothetical protein